MFGRSRGLIGLDIGDSSVKVVELKEVGKGRGHQLARLAWEPLSSEAIVDGQIMDSQLVTETVQRLLQRCRVKPSTSVATALSGHHVIVKRISLPVMNEQELAESIHWEAEQYIPFDIEDVNLDYQILEGSSLSGEGNMDVLLAAAKKDKINDYIGVISDAGYKVDTVDIAAFAMQNAFEVNYDFEPDQVLALVDIGSAVSSISVLHRGTSVYWRDINIGGNHYTDAIQKELNLSADQAEQLKRGEEIDGIPYERVLPIMSAVGEDIGTEIQKTLDFFKQISATDQPLDRMYLTGGTAQVVHLKESLSERLNTQAELLNPFRRIPSAGKDASAELVNDMMPTASVAVGLALRKAGE
ncbi:MAG: pilus assembly protein PilM [Acidobacteriota bacterium]|nr:pilus assembly protein PilM [Acidobacteriota bacterium]MDH3786684.1 pilus assembly protein PilM [Acidobacteriota bacterium]